MKQTSITIFLVFLLLFSNSLTTFFGCSVLASEIDFEFLDFGADQTQYLVGETVELWIMLINSGSQKIDANTLQVIFTLILPNGSQIDAGESWNSVDLEQDTYGLITIEWAIPQNSEGGVYSCQVSAFHHPTSLAKNQTFHNVFEVLAFTPAIDLVARIYVNGMIYERGASVNVGEERLNITYTVFNIGTEDAGSFFVKFRFYGLGTTFIETRNYSSLTHGCSIEYEKVFTVYLNEKYLVHMQVDYLEQIHESNETNNDSLVFIQTYAYPRILQRLETTILSGSWRIPNSQFKISVWDISNRTLDILTSLALQQEDTVVFSEVGEFNDFDGNSVVDDEETKNSLLNAISEGYANDYINFLMEKIQVQNVSVEPEDFSLNFWNFAVLFETFLLNSIEEESAIPIENVQSIVAISVAPIEAVAGGTMTILGVGGYSEDGETYSSVAAIGNGLRKTIVITNGPVDLGIVDSNGRGVNKTINEVNDALYEEKDLNNDGLLEDIITLPPVIVDYEIQVTPEPAAPPESTVILKIISGNTCLTMEKTNVSDISSKTYSLHLADTTAPNFQETLITPQEYIEPYQPVKVQSKIMDDQKIANVTLYYSANNKTTWEILLMEYNQTSGYYETIIPGQPAGTKVKFKIFVYDSAGNRATASETRQNCTYEVIPEFPSITILIPLFLIIFASVVLLNRRIQKRKYPQYFR